MSLRLRPRPGEVRDVDWQAAAVAGFAAGALLMVLEMLWAASMGEVGPWRVSQLVAALTMGPGIASGPPPAHFDATVVGVALVTHYALGVASGLVIGWVLSMTHSIARLGVAETVGVGFGIVVYAFNFHVMTAVLPWFAELRGWSTLIAHMVFGITAALLYWRLARPSVYSLRRAA